jgi:hypothetical protein
MRDSILAALDFKLSAGQITSADHSSARRGIWAAFAKFGMGPNARSNGASLSGIVADFNPPAEPSSTSIQIDVSPNLEIPDNKSTGVSSVLAVPQPGQLARVTVSVDIQHPFIGDLRVALVSPAGTTVVLPYVVLPHQHVPLHEGRRHDPLRKRLLDIHLSYRHRQPLESPYWRNQVAIGILLVVHQQPQHDVHLDSMSRMSI